MTNDSPLRIILWGTGFVGKLVIRELVAHPDFELVGVIVHAPEKDGVDAGEIAGIGPIGLPATRDAASTPMRRRRGARGAAGVGGRGGAPPERSRFRRRQWCAARW